MTNYGPLDIGLSSIGRTNKNSSEEEEIRIRIIQLAAESLLQSGTVDGDLRRREETVDLIGRCKIALAPHKRLSPDVLRSIFHFCGEARVQFPLVSKRDPPCLLRITHVCSALRWKRQLCGATFLSIYQTGMGNGMTRRCFPPDNGSTVHRICAGHCSLFSQISISEHCTTSARIYMTHGISYSNSWLGIG